jgi:hypothetical protein
LPPERFHGVFDIDGVPEDNGGNNQVEAVGAVILVIDCPVPDLAEPVQEYGALESVAGLPDVQHGKISPPQRRVVEP